MKQSIRTQGKNKGRKTEARKERKKEIRGDERG
jgi:hypothetical protein